MCGPMWLLQVEARASIGIRTAGGIARTAPGPMGRSQNRGVPPRAAPALETEPDRGAA